VKPGLVVVDLGCYTHPGYPEDESTRTLIERFDPKTYYGFDPHPDLVERMESVKGGTDVVIFRMAAATYRGSISYDPRPDRPLAAATGSGPLIVPCFDFAAWLSVLTIGRLRVIVKMDVEGAEYTLLPHLIETGAIQWIKRLLIEWHRPPIGPDDWQQRRDMLVPLIPCEVEEW
jgi:FkbM family methyltransferase